MEIEIDRLSSLPDPIIHHILSLIDVQTAVQTAVLSKTWRHYWKNLPSIDFVYRECDSWNRFEKLVLHVMHQYDQLPIRNLCKIRLFCNMLQGSFGPFLDKVIEYAKAHTLLHLEIHVSDYGRKFREITNTLKLGPARSLESRSSSNFELLKTLRLSGVWISVDSSFNTDLFSSCFNLETLFLLNCNVLALESVNISVPGLVNLEIENLRIRNLRDYDYQKTKELVVTAPRLKFFEFDGDPLVVLRMENCQALDNVIINMIRPGGIFAEDWTQEDVWYLISMAKELSHAKSITVALHQCLHSLVLSRNTLDAETTVVSRNTRTREEQLLV